MKEKSCHVMRGVTAHILILAVLLFPLSTFAHGPSKVALSYDTGGQTLAVTIKHNVSNPGSHFIDRVIVSKNGEEVLTQTYTSQPDVLPFTYTYEVPAAAGDTFAVKAECNKFGSRKAKLTVAE